MPPLTHARHLDDQWVGVQEELFDLTAALSRLFELQVAALDDGDLFDVWSSVVAVDQMLQLPRSGEGEHDGLFFAL